MARISQDARSAALYRSGNVAAPPPKALSPQAKLIWRRIVRAKPADWFDASQHGYLADHCETEARLEEVWVGLRQVDPSSQESRVLMNALKVLRANYSVSARHLRLTVQDTIEHKSTKLRERRNPDRDDDLVGPPARLRKVA
jgi:hypothetical protein